MQIMVTSLIWNYPIENNRAIFKCVSVRFLYLCSCCCCCCCWRDIVTLCILFASVEAMLIQKRLRLGTADKCTFFKYETIVSNRWSPYTFVYTHAPNIKTQKQMKPILVFWQQNQLFAHWMMENDHSRIMTKKVLQAGESID